MRNNALIKLLNAAFIYLLLGAGGGVFYREFTKLNDFPLGEYTQLAYVHTHLLTLGFIVLLVAVALEKIFAFSRRAKLFNWFFWLYNAGLLVTTSMLVLHGSLTVLGRESGPAISGIAGLGHIMLAAALIVFYVAVRKAALDKSALGKAAAKIEAGE
ncbi:MAG: DUF2871 domain-containing protein [Buchananella hordeovulneris]|nr:DUF2871 domain-containing protein [Buchananella hordeovulneris]